MDSHYLKIQGKAELPQPITLGHNIHVSLEGSVTSKTESDNEDGTFTYSYKFVPIKVDLLTDKGEMLKLKDTRSMSSLLRARLWKVWSSGDYAEDFDLFYENLLRNIIEYVPEIVGMYYEKKN